MTPAETVIYVFIVKMLPAFIQGTLVIAGADKWVMSNRLDMSLTDTAGTARRCRAKDEIRQLRATETTPAGEDQEWKKGWPCVEYLSQNVEYLEATVGLIVTSLVFALLTDNGWIRLATVLGSFIFGGMYFYDFVERRRPKPLMDPKLLSLGVMIAVLLSNVLLLSITL